MEQSSDVKSTRVYQELLRIADTIRNYYINEKQAAEIAERIEEYLKSERFRQAVISNNMQRIRLNIQSIIYSITEDSHFNILPANYNIPLYGRDFIERAANHYIRIGNFGNTDDPQNINKFIAASRQFQDPLIIDLRGNTGGNMEMCHFVLSHFLPEGAPLFEMVTRATPTPRVFKSVSSFPHLGVQEIKRYNGRLSVLINLSTASAAETFAWTIKRYGRGKLYGTLTCGCSHVTVTTWFDDFVISLPNAILRDPKTHETFEGVGVQPDFEPTSKEYVRFVFEELVNSASFP